MSLGIIREAEALNLGVASRSKGEKGMSVVKGWSDEKYG